MNLTLLPSEILRFLSPQTIGIIGNGSEISRLTAVQVIRHIITPAVCLISMGALIFTLILLHRKKLVRITALIYLKCMGFVDLLSLIFIFILSLDYSSKSFFKAQRFSPALHGCLFGFLFTSNWLMTAQAIERTIAIRKPFKAKQIRERHRRIVVTVIFILSVLFTIPTLALDIMQTERYQEDSGDFRKDEEAFLAFFDEFVSKFYLRLQACKV
ncbi:unnamed protein product [Rodentolepis nana]|uniref:G_PROTEIN_RECEP_F1_2 domain-containing protein n=1 Tax=Rodentolepis nana TaxID=102285 RepID=A0A0R3TM16_RODNA|nr:unnamed protein product [Rodentolepis nana]